MKPPHSNLTHPARQYYRPETDDYPASEVIIERQWREQGGVDPRTGKAWLTPRMERNAVRAAEAMANNVICDPHENLSPVTPKP